LHEATGQIGGEIGFARSSPIGVNRNDRRHDMASPLPSGKPE
jgi:hypothetical protein